MKDSYSQIIDLDPPVKPTRLLGISVSTKIKTRIMDSKTGKCLKESPWKKNLVMDSGLNAIAKSTAPSSIADSFLTCKVGSGTTPTATASGGITGSQTATTTVTSSGGFFTAGMVGMLLKWGTGSAGVETYITAFTNSTTVTVDTSGTHVAEVFTVWAVNQTALTTQLFQTSAYQTNAGDNVTTITNNQAVLQRTFVIASQVASYNVNEIGWFSQAGALGGINVYGRIVLSSTDVVSPTNFYVVVIQLTTTFTPATPSAVANVGTNINTAGNAAIERLAISRVSSTGATDTATVPDIFGLATTVMLFPTVVYTQNANPSETPKNVTSIAGTQFNPMTKTFSGTRGVMNVTVNTTKTTAGQLLFGICLSDALTANPTYFDILFTAAQTAPSGTFQPQTTFTYTFNRALVN